MAERIGVIGLGIMGSSYARNLSGAGLEIIGYDIDEAKVAALADIGVIVAASPADVVAKVDRVITSLPFAAALAAVTGEIAATGKPVVVADTSNLTITEKEGGRAALQATGSILLDCPVGGTGAQAAKGDIVIFGSGDATAFAKIRPVLEKMSRVVYHVGGFGAGSTMKYIHNLLVTIHNCSAAEAFVMASRAGLDLQTVYDVISSSAGTSRIFELRGPMMVAGDYDTNISAKLELLMKTIACISEHAREIGCPTPLFSLATEIHRSALAQGHARSDPAVVCKIMEQWAGVARASTLAPFRVRSFRFQWPSDLATSCALEMETIILGWYVLVETQSVFMLTVFASLLYLGTLLSPMFGVAGDRIGQRAVLCIMRSIYATCALALMVSAFLGVLTPELVLGVTFVVGLVRPSEIGMRTALLGEIMPKDQLIGATGIQRTTQDSARIAGALSGAGLVAALGIGPAYVVVSALYIASILLMLKAGSVWPRARGAAPERRPDDAGDIQGLASPWHSLKAGFVYVWNIPHLRATMLLAFLLNFTAFPLTHNLMPVVAKTVYHSDQTTLGYMVATISSGALIGSLLMSRFAHRVIAARTMILFSVAWYLMLAIFAQASTPAIGIPLLFLVGLSQSIGLVPSAAVLLRYSDDRFRGRIMGIRMLAIYGNLPGLLLSGPLIAGFGYQATATTYCAVGVLFTVLIAVHWREALWWSSAITNTR